MDLVEYFEVKLKKIGLPIKYLIRLKPPCVCFEIFDEQGALFGDGTEKVTSGRLQVDIFSAKASDMRGLRKKAIKAVLGEEEDENVKASETLEIVIMKSYPDETKFEDDVKLYHHVVVFNFEYLTESEVI